MVSGHIGIIKGALMAREVYGIDGCFGPPRSAQHSKLRAAYLTRLLAAGFAYMFAQLFGSIFGSLLIVSNWLLMCMFAYIACLYNVATSYCGQH